MNPKDPNIKESSIELRRRLCINALESGLYEQVHGVMRNGDREFCALGLMYDVLTRLGGGDKNWDINHQNTLVCEDGTDILGELSTLLNTRVSKLVNVMTNNDFNKETFNEIAKDLRNEWNIRD